MDVFGLWGCLELSRCARLGSAGCYRNASKDCLWPNAVKGLAIRVSELNP